MKVILLALDIVNNSPINHSEAKDILGETNEAVFTIDFLSNNDDVCRLETHIASVPGKSRSSYQIVDETLWAKPLSLVATKKTLVDFSHVKPCATRSKDMSYLSDDVSIVISHNKTHNEHIAIESHLSLTNINFLPYFSSTPADIVQFLDPTIEHLFFDAKDTTVHLKFIEEIILSHPVQLKQYLSSGTIKVGGVDINGIDPEVLLGDYSMVFQDVVLFDDTIMENIRLGKHGTTDEEVLAAAKTANCDEFVKKLPNGYATMIGENGAKLSGGERQRISIARALLKDAPIILPDEATASLDVENETKVQGALSRMLANKTVLVIAHRMRTVEAADHIIILSEGKVVEEGTPAQLMAKENGMFSHMARLQGASARWSI